MRSLAIMVALVLAGAPLPALDDREAPLLVQRALPPIAGRTDPVAKSSPASRAPPAGSVLDDALSTPWGLGIISAVTAISGALALFLLRLISIKAMAVVAEAKLGLAEKRSKLAAAAPRRSMVAALSLSEIEEILEQMPEVSPELRAALLKLLELRLKEKWG